MSAPRPALVPFLGLLAVLVGACGTIDLGDNIVPPNVRVDEDRFYCEIAPQILAAHSCATGGTAECTGMSCHASTSSFRLARTVTLPMCTDGAPVGPVDPALADDYRAVTLFLGSDSASSPFWRRPVHADSHPCTVFSEMSPESELIADWIESGAL
ncbi:MAG: hypothetical protein K1X94_16000 [Sandaracinaceae bacterium]|nr:hypothetical protein [Sandaracinaceae bacterium]